MSERSPWAGQEIVIHFLKNWHPLPRGGGGDCKDKSSLHLLGVSLGRLIY